MRQVNKHSLIGHKDQIIKECSPKYSGYLTVFLTLLLTVMLSFCMLLIKGVRQNTICLESECAMDVAMNSVLSEYHRELLKQYDLLFIDTSYGSPNTDYERTALHLKDYMEKNVSCQDLSFSFLYKDLLLMKVKGVRIDGVSVASDEGGKVLRRQAVEVMKQKIGIGYFDRLQQWIMAVQENDLLSYDSEPLHESTLERLEEWEDCVELKDLGFWQQIAEWLRYPENRLMEVVVGKNEVLSTTTIDRTQYLSSRSCNKGTGILEDIEFEDGITDRFLFHEYILNKTGCFVKKKEVGLLSCQLEYILFGGSSDYENLGNMAKTLVGMREAANTISLVQDEKAMQGVKKIAKLIATALTQPEASPAVEAVIVLGWSFLESTHDVKLLMTGKKLPLIKEMDEWHYYIGIDWKEPWGEQDKNGSSEGMDYADYIRILLWTQPKETITYRLMDIMEMDIRLTIGNQSFRMDGCIDSVSATICVGTDNANAPDYTMKRTYGY